MFLCQLLWFSSISRSTSRGTNTYIPFCKVEGFKLLYPRRHRREGRSPRLYCLLVYCMLKQLVCFASCCMHANYNCKLLGGGGLRQVRCSTLDSSQIYVIFLNCNFVGRCLSELRVPVLDYVRMDVFVRFLVHFFFLIQRCAVFLRI